MDMACDLRRMPGSSEKQQGLMNEEAHANLQVSSMA